MLGNTLPSFSVSGVALYLQHCVVLPSRSVSRPFGCKWYVLRSNKKRVVVRRYRGSQKVFEARY